MKKFGLMIFVLLVVCVLLTACAPAPTPVPVVYSQQPVQAEVAPESPRSLLGKEGEVICIQYGERFNFGTATSDLTIVKVNFIEPTHSYNLSSIFAWTWTNDEGKKEYLTNADLWSCNIIK